MRQREISLILPFTVHGTASQVSHPNIIKLGWSLQYYLPQSRSPKNDKTCSCPAPKSGVSDNSHGEMLVLQNIYLQICEAQVTRALGRFKEPVSPKALTSNTKSSEPWGYVPPDFCRLQNHRNYKCASLIPQVPCWKHDFLVVQKWIMRCNFSSLQMCADCFCPVFSFSPDGKHCSNKDSNRVDISVVCKVFKFWKIYLRH